jgi:ubiquinone/menaquinone biosynthesis C-methylase UbiE
MPDLDAIRETWNHESGWVAGGDEWSGPWGGTESLWWGTLVPRIHSFVPAGVVLELGPGQGRWSNYLKDLAEQLILVDVAEHCLDVCRRRFADALNVSCHLGDGTSLPMVPDRSVDFAFSFDSLVHAEADVLHAYASELARVLKPDGIGFIHHSNMGEYTRAAALARRVPERLRKWLTIRGLVVNVYAWRAETTSARSFAGACAQAGLSCVGQELIAWEYGRHLSDTISLVTPRGSRWERATRTVRNPDFMDEARSRASVMPLYGMDTWHAARP